jgi:ankyrin repeat protein
MAVIRGDLAGLSQHMDADAMLLHRRFADLDFGTTGARMLTLRGGALLHVVAEFQQLDAATLLLARGADFNAAVTRDEAGIAGQTLIFHAATQRDNAVLPLVRRLVERGADLRVVARLPGHCEEPGAVVECTPLGYALRLPGDQGPTSACLRAMGGAE